MATEKEQAESPPGEEDLSFNPALNPNAGDKILRAQQVSSGFYRCPFEAEQRTGMTPSA